MSGLEVALALDGEPYRVRCDLPQVAEEVRRWASLLPPAAGTPAELELRTRGLRWPAVLEHGRVVRQADAVEFLVPALERVLYERLLRPGRPRCVVHAAAAVPPGGRGAVLFAADSGAGKSVLSARLAARGWTYLSDEFAPLDPEGRLHPVPRPVTFASHELPGALWDRLSAGRTWWTSPGRDPDGTRREGLLLRPQEAPPASGPYSVVALYRLQARPGAAPRLRRMPPAQLRAWLFAQARAAARNAAAPAT